MQEKGGGVKAKLASQDPPGETSVGSSPAQVKRRTDEKINLFLTLLGQEIVQLLSEE